MGALSVIIAFGIWVLIVTVVIQAVLLVGSVLLVIPKTRQNIGPCFAKSAIHIVAMYAVFILTTIIASFFTGPLFAVLLAMLATAYAWNRLINKLFDATDGQGTICFIIWAVAGYYLPKLFGS